MGYPSYFSTIGQLFEADVLTTSLMVGMSLRIFFFGWWGPFCGIFTIFGARLLSVGVCVWNLLASNGRDSKAHTLQESTKLNCETEVALDLKLEPLKSLT